MKATVFWIVLFLSLSLNHAPVLAADGPQLSYPQSGDALQGLVIITGKTDLAGFQSAEISFNYLSSNPGTWFLIQQSSTSVRDGALAVWDTTTIADGTYRLRIRIILKDGQSFESITSGLRVRNYTPIETNTPAPIQATELADATPTSIPPTLTRRPTPTPLPPNPIAIKPLQLAFGWIEGAAAAVIGLGLLGLYLRAKRR